MGKKTELRVRLNGEETEALITYCRENGRCSWAAAVRNLILRTKSGQRAEPARSGGSHGDFIQ